MTIAIGAKVMSNVAQASEPRNETRRIYRYRLETGHGKQTTLLLPLVCDILHIGAQQGSLCMWAMVDIMTWPERPVLEANIRTFEVYGDESDICDVAGLKHLGSSLVDGRAWHAFERIGGK